MRSIRANIIAPTLICPTRQTVLVTSGEARAWAWPQGYEKYPAAGTLKESYIADSSFIDELQRNGFINRLYSGDGK